MWTAMRMQPWYDELNRWRFYTELHRNILRQLQHQWCLSVSVYLRCHFNDSAIIVLRHFRYTVHTTLMHISSFLRHSNNVRQLLFVCHMQWVLSIVPIIIEETGRSSRICMNWRRNKSLTGWAGLGSESVSGLKAWGHSKWEYSRPGTIGEDSKQTWKAGAPGHPRRRCHCIFASALSSAPMSPVRSVIQVNNCSLQKSRDSQDGKFIIRRYSVRPF